MLTELYIRNYLFVPEQRLSFKPGMTVISGETGAGKSILVGSIALIFGDRSVELEAYDPRESIYLEACFELQQGSPLGKFLASQGYEDLEELILARDCSPTGRNQYFLCGRKVALSLIKDLKSYIIDFHHQRDQQKLLGSAYQLELLDSYAGLQEEREAYAASYRALRAALSELNALRRQEKEDLQLKELYQYQFEELDKAALQENEDKALQEEFELLSHSKEITELSLEASGILTEAEDSLYDRLRYLISHLANLAHLDSGIKRASEALTEAQAQIEEASALLTGTSSHLDADPLHLSRIQERLDLINSLVYKHKVGSIRELLELFTKRQAQLDAMQDNTLRIAALLQSTAADYEKLVDAADSLSLKRSLAAAKLSTSLLQEIKKLSIPKASLEIRIDKKAIDKKSMQSGLALLDESGSDEIVLLFSANPGASLKPLAAVASGGELSRVLLAIKKVLSERMPTRLVILDEIDSGIGGKAAEEVADFIHQLSKRHRVLCISHLAQIAVVADSHYAIEKSSSVEKTRVDIIPLSGETRQQEIARMLSGSISELSLLHAKELIDKRGNK